MSYPAGFYFTLSINTLEKIDVAFQEVSGLSKEMAIEEISEGEENRFKYKLPSGSKFTNLILKRALVPGGSWLLKWCSDSLDSGLGSAISTKTVTIHLLGADGMVSTSWDFFNAYLLKYSVSEFKSDENEIVIESIELAYTYFTMNK